MTPIVWMAAASIGAWLVVRMAGGEAVHPEALFGMLGPLASASGTWMAVSWTHRVAPARLTAVMMAGFALKMVFFAAYVAILLQWLQLRPMPFVVSFTAYFIGLYAMEALFLLRLMARMSGQPDR